MRHRRLLVVLAGTIVALAGCSSSRKIPPLKPLPEPTSLRTVWTAALAGSTQAVLAPAFDEGGIYAASERGVVIRLDPGTGRELWRVDLRKSIQGGVGAGGGLVLVGTPEGEVIALGADGKVRWEARVSSEVVGVPLITGDLVVVRSADTRIFGLEARDGKRRWVFQRTPPPLVVRTPATIVGRKDLVYAGLPGGKIAAVATASGNLRWESTVSVPRGATELERVTDVVGAPWLAEREVCAGTFQGRTACFDTNTGTTLWTRDVSTSTGLAGDARYVFITDEKSAVIALDRSTGSSMWRQDQLVGRGLSAPVVVDRFVVVGDSEGFVHVLARDTGTIVGRSRTDGTPIASPALPVPGGVLVQTRGGGLAVLGLPAN